MATKVNPAPVTNETPAPASAPIADAVASKAKERAAFLASLTFGEAYQACANSARWHDVIGAAKEFGQTVAETAKKLDGKSASQIARASAVIAPSKAMAFRFALASYVSAKSGANQTQLAELSAALPALQTKGKMADRAVSYGGIALPPILGEL